MPSIIEGMLGAVNSPTMEALGQAAREPVGPWLPSTPLPLPEVEWALTVNSGELSPGQHWPPTRFGARQERLQLYHDLWRGDLSSLIDVRQLNVNSVSATNLFRRLSKFVADLLVRERPTAGQTQGALADIALMRVVHSAASQAIRSGVGAIMFASTSAGPMLRAIDSRWLYRTHEGGWLIVEPRILPRGTSATVPDALQAITITPDFQATASTISGTPTGIGANITVGPVTAIGQIGTAMLLPTLALPEQAEGYWGTSWFDDLMTIVIQKARRMAANTRVLDGNSEPLLLMRGDLNNYTTIAGVPRSSATEPSPPDEIERETAVARRLRQLGPLTVPSGIENAEYVTWDGSLEAAISMLEANDKDFALISGLASVLTSETQVASGMSIRRMFWQFDAGVAPIFHGLYDAMTMGLGALGHTLQWENALEAMEETPLANEREDVEDEGEARRGEGVSNE